MAVFVHTGIFVAVRNSKDRNQRAKDLMRHALQSEFGFIHTSDYVVDETVTTALARTHNHRIAINAGKYILSSPRIQMLLVSQDDFDRAWNKFQKFDDKLLSFTDCTSLAVIERHGIERIMSFDSEFDGLLERIY